MNKRVVGGAIVTAIAIVYLHLVLSVYYWLADLRGSGLVAPTWDHLALVALLVGLGWWGTRRQWLARGLPIGLTVLLVAFFLLGIAQGFARREFGYDVVLALHLAYVPELFKMLYDGETLGMFLVYIAMLAAVLALITAGVHAAIGRVLREAGATRNRRIGIAAGTAAYAVIAIPLAGIHGPLTAEMGRQIDTALHIEQHLDEAGQRMTLETSWLKKRNPFRQLERPPTIYVFMIESYGRALFTDDFPQFQSYAGTAEGKLRQAGYGLRSRYLTAPVFGGSSWMANATLLCGVRIQDQKRFEALYRSEVACLPRLLNEAGYHTILAASNITYYDERFMGVLPFKQLYYRDNLGYKGPRFTWSYMPDQYTIQFVHERELTKRGDTPTLAYFILTSSHHPWSKLPRYVADWNTIGDGSIFARLPPQKFRNSFVGGKQVNQGFAMSIEYSFQVVVEYLLREAVDDNTLVIVMGDHQPRAPIADLKKDTWDVPVHILSRNPALVESFAALGYTPGFTPNPDAPDVPMEGFLLHLLKALAP
ncbi:MAG TPA: sulfatase-like hydrolase/transferase [Haliangium sp.]|nr:sulfatase-like hydrolase/transferase [Haliangium sp.]